MVDVNYLPGMKAVLVFTDERGVSRSSIVEIVHLGHITVPNGWQAIKARKDALQWVENVTPIGAPKFDVEDNWSISIVSEANLASIGTRVFSIVQKGELIK